MPIMMSHLTIIATSLQPELADIDITQSLPYLRHSGTRHQVDGWFPGWKPSAFNRPGAVIRTI